MISEGIVNEIGKTDKGTPKAKIDGNWYYAGRGIDIAEMKTGQKVGVEYSMFGKNNDLRGLKSWALLPHQPPQAAAAPKSNPAVSDDAEMRFISNCVGQAIAAGTIKSPAEIIPWFKAAREALKDSEDEIPY